ncbi:hypothetical protein K1T71_014108 [Dendrolimus kikuchii]|uniref:Uncharacterized protein n=1 Tax=Dendrolimus kikuchii TaxID=765133 RepID=A0ACC1CF00_9NEOP|nr:hypothetical protein K1T71_014108 [Dendrolimus kikuchii]
MALTKSQSESTGPTCVLSSKRCGAHAAHSTSVCNAVSGAPHWRQSGEGKQPTMRHRYLSKHPCPERMRSTLIICLLAIACLFHATEANYRKPPLNGSIFGKRGNIDYDSTARALSALCEITTETCQAWYQALENKK